MKEKIKKIFIILLTLISLYNMYKVIDCFMWINNTKFWNGGLGKAEFYIGFGILVILLQSINIILLTKYNKNIKIKISIVIAILIITYFVPIYGFSILYPYINLYRINIF